MHKKHHLVLVDDDLDILNVYQCQMMILHVECHAFADPLQAIDYLKSDKKNQVTGIICDVSMAGLSGVDFLQTLIELDLIVRPFIFLSGHYTDQARAQLIALGADYLVEKPMNCYELIAIIEEICDQW